MFVSLIGCRGDFPLSGAGSRHSRGGTDAVSPGTRGGTRRQAGVHRRADRPDATYSGWAEAVRGTAAGLAARGFRKGDVFAIYSPNLPEYAVAFHAVSLARRDRHHDQSVLHDGRARASSSTTLARGPRDRPARVSTRPAHAARDAGRARGVRVRRGERCATPVRVAVDSRAAIRRRSRSTRGRRSSRCRTRAARPACPRA